MRWSVLAVFILSLSFCIAGKVQERTQLEVERLNFRHCLQTCDQADKVGTCVSSCWGQHFSKGE